jgi:serine protease AprX
MLQANPELTPDQVKQILQETATPMLGYSRYEVGAGYLNTYAAVRKSAFNTPFGQFRGGLGGAVSLTQDPVTSFSGAVAPGASYTKEISVPDDTVFLSVEAGWLRSAGVAANNLEVSLSRAGESHSSATPVQLAGPALKKAGVTVSDPAPGAWTLTVTNTSDSIRGSSQEFNGAVEIIRASYSAGDLGQMPAAEQRAAKLALRSGLVQAVSNQFVGGAAATRLDAARAVMLAAHLPQYLPYSQTFADVAADEDAIFIESVTRSPRGNLFGATGGAFNPQGGIDRLAVAVAMVKSYWADGEIQAASGSNPGLADWDSIPASARGFVSLAVSKGLMSADSSGSFRPAQQITRAELAAAAVALQQAAR